MITLQRTLKCLPAICLRRDGFCEVLCRCSNTTRYLEHDVHIVPYIKHIENAIMPKRNKQVKLDWSKLPKLICSTKKKTDSKKNIKEKRRGKKKSIVSQFLIEENTKKVNETNDSDDIVIVYDSTAGERRETETVASSSDSEDSINMGNVMSENLDPSGFANDLDWTNCNYFLIPEQTSSQLSSQSLIVPNLQSQLTSDSQHKDGPERRQLKSMRHWKYTKFGSNLAGAAESSSHLVFTLLSYNVLAQGLLESHTYLYKRHLPRALAWEYRSWLLFKEIQEADADIMCLQEVQESHLDSFYSKLKNLGYEGIFKGRTGENVDGVAIYYKRELFDLVDHTSVEYFQPGIDVLNRHNVGLIAKLAVKRRTGNVQQHIVVASTHLLFNPRRHDVKLAQMQLLLTEVERYAFQGFKYGAAVYWPVIITGDMNFEPKTGVYNLVTEGMFKYEGLSNKTLDGNTYNSRVLGKELLPRSLDILDTCQHWGILCKRLIEKMDHKTELTLLRLRNTDHERILKQLNMTRQAPKSFEDFVTNARSEGLINNFVPFFGPSPIPPMPDAGFATGQLNHNLNLRSVYSHYDEENKKAYATTYQSGWVTVDYIFFSCKKKDEGSLKLVAKYKLLNTQEATSMGPIPNLASPSDHYPLMAAFYLKL